MLSPQALSTTIRVAAITNISLAVGLLMFGDTKTQYILAAIGGLIGLVTLIGELLNDI